MSNEKNSVKSVAKAFAVLEAFTAEESELVIADVARAAGLDNATAFRMLNTFEQLGYVQRVPDSRKFRLTLKCLDLGFNAIARSDLRSLARPLLRDIVGDKIEAASIGVFDPPDIVYIERVQAGLHRLAVDVRIGNRVPVFSTALGRAILSRMPVEVRREFLEAHPPQALTARTNVDVDSILDLIAKAEIDGYVVSDQETVNGLRIIAAPIVDADGTPIAAISAATPAFGQTLEEFIAYAKAPTCETAESLSRAMSAAGATAAYRPEPRPKKRR